MSRFHDISAVPVPTRSHIDVPGLRQFDGAVIAAPEITTITVQALLVVEGKQTDSEGSTINYTKKLLKEIVAESNRHRASGERIPLLEGKSRDHEYAQGNVIGQVDGDFALLEISEENLPHPGMDDLIGKQGIFAQIKIAGEENVTKYFDGRLKKLSVGIAGKIIWEVSAVVWGAIAGASLYTSSGDLKLNDFVEWEASGGTARGLIEEIATEGTLTPEPSGTEMEGSEDDPVYLVSVWGEVEGGWEATDTRTVHRVAALSKIAPLKKMKRILAGRKTHALTIADNLQEIALRERMWEVHRIWDAFTSILYELMESDSEEVSEADRDAVLTQAIADLTKLLQQKLDLSNLTFSAITTHALTIAAQLQEDQESADDLWWAFKDVLKSVQDATAAQLGDRTRPQWLAQAVDDLAAQIRLRLQISANPAPLPTVPLFSNPAMTTDKKTYTAEDFAALESRSNRQDRQIAIFAKRDGLLTRYTNLRMKGDKLRREGKMTPVSHKAKFGSLPTAIATYSALPSTDEALTQAETDLTKLDQELGNLEYHLGELEQHAEPVRFSTYTGDEPLPDPESTAAEEDKEASEFLKSYTPSRSY